MKRFLLLLAILLLFGIHALGQGARRVPLDSFLQGLSFRQVFQGLELTSMGITLRPNTIVTIGPKTLELLSFTAVRSRGDLIFYKVDVQNRSRTVMISNENHLFKPWKILLAIQYGCRERTDGACKEKLMQILKTGGEMVNTKLPRVDMFTNPLQENQFLTEHFEEKELTFEFVIPDTGRFSD